MDLQHLNVPAQLETLLMQITDNPAVSTKFRLDIAGLTSKQRSGLVSLLSIVKAKVQLVEKPNPATCDHSWRFGRSERARLRARECMKCDQTEVLLTEGSFNYAIVKVVVVPVPEWLIANPHWKKHWEL